MTLLHDRRIPLLAALVLLLVPLDIYVIGERVGTGVQWVLFRYQDSSYGTSLITVARETEYVTSGIIAGKSAVSLSLWIAGATLLLAACIALAVLIAEHMDDRVHLSGLAVIASGFLFIASCMVQYGPFLSGPAGFSVPVGIPLVWAVGWWIFSQEKPEPHEGEEGKGEEDLNVE